MNHRFVVPALGLIALSATAASAQEVAKGLFVDGYVDTIFTGASATNNTDGRPIKDSHATTDFTTEAVLKVGYNIGDKVKALVATRTGGDTGSLALVEAYGTVDAGNGLTVSSGKSYGPFGYYSGYSTGLTTINYALSLKLYTVNPVGVWATYTVNDKFSATVIVADGFANNTGLVGKPTHTAGADGSNNVSPGLDFVFNPTPEVSLNLEGFIDPNAGGDKSDGQKTNIAQIGFNAQYKKDAWLAAGEILSRTSGGKGETADDSYNELAWAAFVTYTIPDTKIPMAATLQLSQYLTSKTPTADSDALTKVQAALLTNPTGSSQFGLNFELFYLTDDKKNNVNVSGSPIDSAANSIGVAIEGLYVIP